MNQRSGRLDCLVDYLVVPGSSLVAVNNCCCCYVDENVVGIDVVVEMDENWDFVVVVVMNS